MQSCCREGQTSRQRGFVFACLPRLQRPCFCQSVASVCRRQARPQPLEAFTPEPASFSSALLQPLGSSKAAAHSRKWFEGSTAWEPRTGIYGWSQPSTGFLYYTWATCATAASLRQGQLFLLLWATVLCHLAPVAELSENCSSGLSMPYLKLKGR